MASDIPFRPDATTDPTSRPTGVSTVVAPRQRLWATGFSEAGDGSRAARVRRALMSAADLRALVSGPERVVAWRLSTGDEGPEPVVFPSGELAGRWFVADDAQAAVRLAMEAAVLDRGRCLRSLAR